MVVLGVELPVIVNTGTVMVPGVPGGVPGTPTGTMILTFLQNYTRPEQNECTVCGILSKVLYVPVASFVYVPVRSDSSCIHFARGTGNAFCYRWLVKD